MQLTKSMNRQDISGKEIVLKASGQIKCDTSILSILSVEEISFIEVLLGVKLISS